MGLFGNKKKKPERHKRMLPIEMRRRVLIPKSRPRLRLTSREYRIFKKGEKFKLTWYERLVRMASSIIHVGADKGSKPELEAAIRFTGLKITADGVMSP
jgi:hypothetical protein